MKILVEHCYGTHIYYKVEYKNKEYEIDQYIRNEGDTFQVSDEAIKDELIIELMKVW